MPGRDHLVHGGLQIPVGNGPAFSGVVDVLRSEAFTFTSDGATRGEVPAEHQSALEDAHAQLMENAAESGEALMNKYFEEGALTQEELVTGLHAGIAQGDLYPVFFCSALAEKGLTQVLDDIADLMPGASELPPIPLEEGKTYQVDAGAPLLAQVFRTSSETHVGEIYFVRVLSGALKAGAEVFNGTRNGSEKVSQLFNTARKLFKERRFSDAAEAMRQVLVLDPANADSNIQHQFNFTPSTSFYVFCDTDEEVDRLKNLTERIGDFIRDRIAPHSSRRRKSTGKSREKPAISCNRPTSPASPGRPIFSIRRTGWRSSRVGPASKGAAVSTRTSS